ncbi:transposase [Paramaledivibacter caminithermalis]|jgi:hypothetical protein|uniref:Transposase domain n=1 Tax=Paramaledivibacter caminithermalis (strain DSM 15212 / CIP 107654 / DViRD3) TaxID=1121301 RepID=A0A1M6U6X9_PARC5|nr:transposase [Paramaledivibacter caminithermalis]SHK64911.1 Transposase domain [Paramaledivibacter caminithermalis DSM 15212]
MFRENTTHTQENIFNSTNWMNPRVRDKLSKSWAPIFYEDVFCKIDEKPFTVLYSDIGRSNFPVNILLSLEYIKHMFNYSDDDLIENFYFNYLINYAVGIRTLGEINLAKRTLYEFRSRVYNYTLKNPDKADLIFEQFINLTEEFGKKLGVSFEEQRMDSTFITSNIKKAGRLSLAFDVLTGAVKVIPVEYLTDSFSLKEVLNPAFKTDILYKSKPNETSSKLDTVLNLISEVITIADTLPELNDENVIKLAKRFIKEQAEYDNKTQKLKAKNKKEIPTDSLQSAYYEDATFRTKAGKGNSGYVLNLSETCSKDNPVQLITDYKVDKNITADVNLIKERLPIIKENTVLDKMYVDGGYYSEDVVALAKEKDVDINFTDMTGKKPSTDKLPINNFEIDEDEKIIKSCPKGHTPIRLVNKSGQAVAHFDKKHCDKCEFKDICRIKEQKKQNVVRISNKAIIAERERKKIDKNKKESTSKRAGIKGTNSALKRGHGLAKLQVRRQYKVQIVTGFKVTAHNIKRHIKQLLRSKKLPKFTADHTTSVPILG